MKKCIICKKPVPTKQKRNTTCSFECSRLRKNKIEMKKYWALTEEQKEQLRKKERERYHKNPEKYRTKERERYHNLTREQKDIINKRNLYRYHNNPLTRETARKCQREWYQKNREHVKKYSRQRYLEMAAALKICKQFNLQMEK